MLTEDRKTVSVERVGQTQWITFRRSEQMNAMSMQMLDEMAGALVQAMTDDEVRAGLAILDGALGAADDAL